MDVSFNNVLESTRKYFQGVPTSPNNSVGGSAASSVGNTGPNHPGAATPVQPPQHGFQNNPPPTVPSSSPTVLSYWPPTGSQRSKDTVVAQTPPNSHSAIQSQNHYVQNQQSGKSPSLTSQLHTVYNGRLQESVQPTNYLSDVQTNQPSQRHQHNLPPIAALSSSVNYHSGRTTSRESSTSASQSILYHRQSSQVPQQHLPLPSISQINIHATSKPSSLSPRTMPPQYRTADYSQGTHSSYSPSTLTNQNHARDSTRAPYQQIATPKYQHSSSSPVVSSANLNYNYTHNSSIPTSTIPAASYPQSSSSSTSSVYVNSTHQQRQQQLQQQQQNIQIHIQQQQQLLQQQSQNQQSHHSNSQSHNQQNNQPTLTQQHQQALQQHQASLYQQSLQHSINSRQADVVKEHHQQTLKSHQYSSNVHNQQQQQHPQQQLHQQQSHHHQQQQHQQQPSQQHQQQRGQQQQQQQQQQAYYTSTSSSNSRPSSQIAPAIQTTNHQRSAIPARQTSGVLKRESPLDLSVKTVRQSADSTAKDESENVFNNVAAFHSHEMLHMRTKTPPKTTNSRGSAILPPLQLPTSVVYPTFETHGNSNPPNPPQSMTGAPKVDFLPNFQQNLSPQLPGNTPTVNYHTDIKKRHRKSSSSHSNQSTPNQYTSYQGSLPHMGSFKKTSIPGAAYEHHNKQAQFYPATGPPSHHRTPTTVSLTSSLGTLPSLSSATLNQYPFDPTKRGNDSGYEYIERRTSNNSGSGHSASPVEGNYPPAKRPSSSDLRHPLPAKITKVDTWRQTIDQQIEQRLNSYARGQQINGVTNESSGNNDGHRQHSQTITSYSLQSLPNSHQSSQNHSSNHSLLDRQQSYTVNRIPSNPSLSVPYYPSSNLPQYANQNASPRSQEGYQHSTHSRLPVLPNNNGAADKRVLSILRNSLEIKEARNLQLQQQQQQLHQESLLNHGKVYHSLEPRAQPAQLFRNTNQNKSPSAPAQPPVGRHNLPPFGAIALERTSTPPYPGYKLPKAVDSVRLDNEQNLSREKIQNSHQPRPGDVPHRFPRNDVLPKTGQENNTTSGQESGGEFDGLAAFLAARIRTKAELKQVGPSVGVDNTRTPTPASSVISGSNSSVHSPRTTPGIFSPPPASLAHHLASAADIGKVIPLQEGDQTALPSGSGGSTSSPPKLIRERGVINSPRRRLFSRPDDEPVGGVIPASIVTNTVGGSLLPSREPGGLRSSSEASVFDFRESDSEGEMPVLERQSLHEMRRDRDKRILEKQQATALVHTDESSKQTKETTNTEEGDSFWSETCSMFLEQLQTGASNMRRRGRRKKMREGTINEKSLKVEPNSETQVVDAQLSDNTAMSSLCDVLLPVGAISASSDLQVVEADIKPENTVCDIVMKNVEKEICIKKEEEVPDKSESINMKRLDVPVKKVEVIIKAEVLANKEQKSMKKDEAITVKKEEEIKMEEKSIKKEEESSDEDLPLSLRRNEFKKEKAESLKIELAKKVASESEGDSSADECNDTVARRLRLRKPKEMSAAEEKQKKKQSSPKKTKKQIEDKKKPNFGDGTDFRPGWEEELYKYKRSLRMPARLINISRPPTWPRISVSLPDLDPDSPMTLDSLDFSTNCKKHDSDIEASEDCTKAKDSGKAGDENSFLNRLVKRYGGKGKKSLRKNNEKEAVKESKGPKIIPQKDGPELLPTPSLDLLMRSPNKKVSNSNSTGKSPKGHKVNNSDLKSSDCENDDDSVYLGYFRKQTVAGFREAFVRHNGGFANEHEFPPIVLKSRTRTQTRVMQQRATIREVFGEDRPASAPPAGCREENNDKSNTECEVKKSVKDEASAKVLMRKRVNSSASSSGTRAGLRSAAVLRSNKAVLKSKQQLLHGNERRKRNTDLLKAYASVKKHHQETEDIESEVVDKKDSEGKLDNLETPSLPLTIGEKRLKLRTIRRKLRSSGFDYIRKKKKQQQKKEGEKEGESVKERRKGLPLKPNPESEEDIQNEIKGWVINKGLGETILHRAARLGYTDIAAYCLEKMDHNPSPRDNAGYTPLHEACSRGHLDIARLLLMYGANVSDSAHSGIRPLHEAVENGFTEIIRLLLSYGADPLLATYSGHTPLSLANDPDTKALMQHHLADVQGLPAPPWNFTSAVDDPDPLCIGYNCFSDIPSPDNSDNEETEVEFSEMCTPNLYQLLGEPHTDRWVLFQEIGPVLRVKTREALIKQLGQSHRNDFRDLKMTDFYDTAKCCTVLGVGDNILNPKAHKVTLVKYTDKVRSLLNMDKILVSGR